MAHISSIGAGLFSDLAVTVAATALPATPNASNFAAEFGTIATDFVRITDVREFPSLGTPPNIVNVPVYGQRISSQIQGQADAPTLEITLNFIPSLWASGTTLGDMVGDSDVRLFRFALLNDQPAGYSSTTGATGLGSTANSVWYWAGRIEALQINPQLTDANTATLTLSIQSDFYGAYTVAAA